MEPTDADCAAVEGTGCLAERGASPCGGAEGATGETAIEGEVIGGGCACGSAAPAGGWLALAMVWAVAWRR